MDIVAQLRRDEGVKYTPYRDTKGILTVGVGRNIEQVPFSEDEVNLMLVNDIKNRVKELGQFVWFRELDEIRQAFVINVAFAGIGTLMHFVHMLSALAKKDWTAAAQEFENSAYYKEVGERGPRLKQQLLTGEWV